MACWRNPGPTTVHEPVRPFPVRTQRPRLHVGYNAAVFLVIIVGEIARRIEKQKLIRTLFEFVECLLRQLEIDPLRQLVLGGSEVCASVNFIRHQTRHTYTPQMGNIRQPAHSSSQNLGNAPSDAQYFGLSQNRDWSLPGFGNIGPTHSKNFADAHDLLIATIAPAGATHSWSPPFRPQQHNSTVRRIGLPTGLYFPYRKPYNLHILTHQIEISRQIRKKTKQTPAPTLQLSHVDTKCTPHSLTDAN
ncbi:Uncharacterised protein [Burkholderia cenocepacia]|nr:hypothetical protein K562_13156 [Burkholderia cenocepacia]SPU87172.1 Uncharacterised protein [Burkholderia cenocepacia]SPU99832.1 Uncharacterised protein [Burkholderia cenocepacia]